MKKEKFKKIPISKFISDKELSKINKIINSSESVDVAYDRIETLLDDNFKVKGLGTNRLIFIHKKDKFKDLVFKVAGDSHGVEANYREFYNGDLDKRLTFSYSISDDGLFLVQERVTVFDSKMMKEHKKEVRKILKHLSHKLLLVDCRISNFKNFGIRKNGDIVVLDHGDTVPLQNNQTNNIVNIDEESNVSLRCKRLKDAANEKLKPCGGKLEYSKDYEYLICKKCGSIMNVNDAYKEFYGDSHVNANIHNDFISGLDFDPKAWSKVIKSYAKDKMSSVNKNNIKNEGECEMKEKVINGAKCRQMKGYWIPENYLTNPAYTMLVNSMKLNKIKPKEFVKTIGLDPSEYAVKIEDHTPNKNKEEWQKQLPVIVNEVIKLINEHVANGETRFDIYYKEVEERCGFPINTYEKEKSIYQKIINTSNVEAFIYKKDRFVVIINNESHDEEPKTNATIPDDISTLLGISPKENNSVTESKDDTEDNTYVKTFLDDEEDTDTDEQNHESYNHDMNINEIDDSYDEEDNDEINEYKNSDGSYNFDKINEDHDFYIIESKLSELISEADVYTEHPGYSYKRVDTSYIRDVFADCNSTYGNLFDDIVNSDPINIELIKEFIRKCMPDMISNYSFIDSNRMNGKDEIDFVLSNSHPEYISDNNDDSDGYVYDSLNSNNDDEDELDEFTDEEYYVDDSEETTYDTDNSDSNYSLDENLNSNEQSYEIETEEDAEMPDLRNRVEKLESQVAELTSLIKDFIDSFNGESDKDEESDDSDDDSIAHLVENDNVLTIDADKIPDDSVIIFNKNGILYRLNPQKMFIGTTEGALYDIAKATLQRIDN